MQFLLNLGIIIYAIGIGKAIEEELLEIASEPSYKHLFYAEDFTAMEDISEELRAQICEGKSISLSLRQKRNEYLQIFCRPKRTTNVIP